MGEGGDQPVPPPFFKEPSEDKEMTVNIEQIAKVCHETNRAYCLSIGDNSQNHWNRAAEWQRQSAREGVKFALANPDAPASASHEVWLKDKEADGWKFGPVKSLAKKEHPCMVPYAKLPPEQQLKDHLFRAVVRAFAEAYMGPISLL